MIASVDSGFAGWSEYTLGKDYDRPGATLIEGDPELGDLLCEQSQYSNGNYFRFVLSFSREELNPDDPADRERGREIAKEFFSKLMHGYREDEYHLDLVEHIDNGILHYHARIPKQNLLTGTKLEVYYHKRDLNFKKAIIDWQAAKHGLLRGEDRRRVRPTDRKEIIEKWREERGKPEPKFKTKKERRENEAEIASYIEELTTAGLINSLDEVKALVESLGLKIEKADYDRGKGFHYFTVVNKTGKMRIKGDYYGAEFWQHKAADREAAIRDNQRIRTDRNSDSIDLAEAEARLQKELAKRERLITKRYRAARERADRKNRRDLIQGDAPGKVVDLSSPAAPRPSGRSVERHSLGVSAQRSRPDGRDLVSTEGRKVNDEIERRNRAIGEAARVRREQDERERSLFDRLAADRQAGGERAGKLLERIGENIEPASERIAEAAIEREAAEAERSIRRLADTVEQLASAVNKIRERAKRIVSDVKTMISEASDKAQKIAQQIASKAAQIYSYKGGVAEVAEALSYTVDRDANVIRIKINNVDLECDIDEIEKIAERERVINKYSNSRNELKRKKKTKNRGISR